MISAIIPTYRSPKYLDLCLQSAIENKQIELTQIVVIVDGYAEDSKEVLEKYKDHIGLITFTQNMGMAHALNVGVWQSTNPVAFILNDDNVFPEEWDVRLAPFVEEVINGSVVTVNQIEPHPSIFNFPVAQLGQDAETFEYDKFLVKERETSTSTTLEDGRIFPFLVSKRNYMAVGGFDTFYQSPFYVDVDFWLKLELLGASFKRINHLHLYHFGSKATKMGPEGDRFRNSEQIAGAQFMYKWGYVPNIVDNVKKNNTKFPKETNIRGIKF